MRAIILAAGQGTRLRPLTDDIPKCLVSFNGRPMVAWMLDGLIEAGIEHLVFAAGYRADRLRQAIGVSYRGIPVDYVDNPEFATTNNIVSLYLTRNYFDQDLILAEGDIRLDGEILSRMVNHHSDNVALVAPWTTELDGTVVRTEGAGITEFVLKKDQGPGFDHQSTLKTVNIYRLGRDMLSVYAERLGQAIDANRTDDYYEAVLGEMVNQRQISMTAELVGDARWAEADTPEDLLRAELIFAEGQN